MSLRRAPTLSVNDTATIDFKDGYMAKQETSVIETLKSEIAELKTKVATPMCAHMVAAAVPQPATTLDHRMGGKSSNKPHNTHKRSVRPESRHTTTVERAAPDEFVVPPHVLQKMHALETQLAKQEMRNKSDQLAQTVMSKLNVLESRMAQPQVMSKLDALESKLSSAPHSQISAQVMRKLDALESKLGSSAAPHISTQVMSKLDALESKLGSSAAPHISTQVMSKLDALESKLGSAAAPHISTQVMSKLDALESKLGSAAAPHISTQVMSKLDALESKLNASVAPHISTQVMSKLDALESKLSAPRDHVPMQVMSKLDALESKLKNSDSLMAKLNSIEGRLPENNVKEQVLDKLARLEEQVRLKSAAPPVTLETYHAEQAKLDKLERMRARMVEAM